MKAKEKKELKEAIRKIIFHLNTEFVTKPRIEEFSIGCPECRIFATIYLLEELIKNI